MKTLKFRGNLVPMILAGQKNSTWRLFDDKDLQVGDTVELLTFSNLEKFGEAIITEVVEKPFGKLSTANKEGHEAYVNDEEMYRTYSTYYKTEVGPKTLLKIIRFKLKD